MKRIILSALVALTAFGGVASADRWHGDVRHSQGGVSVTHSHGRYVQPRHVTYNRGYVSRPSYRYVRRPIYVQRPRIAFRYYNYYQRPALLVENYAAVPGYYWVSGQWNWDGYEWIWTPGHYEPDPNAAGYYSNAYGTGYYDNPYYNGY